MYSHRGIQCIRNAFIIIINSDTNRFLNAIFMIIRIIKQNTSNFKLLVLLHLFYLLGKHFISSISWGNILLRRPVSLLSQTETLKSHMDFYFF